MIEKEPGSGRFGTPTFLCALVCRMEQQGVPATANAYLDSALSKVSALLSADWK